MRSGPYRLSDAEDHLAEIAAEYSQHSLGMEFAVRPSRANAPMLLGCTGAKPAWSQICPRYMDVTRASP